MLKLYENIKKRRLELNLTQDELARLMGYTDRSSIAKIEAGKVDLTNSKIYLFAKALRTSVADLMGIKIGSDLENLLVQVAQELDVEIDEMKNFFLTTDISGDPVNPSLNKENIKQAYLFFKHSNLSNSSINDINLLTVYNRLNDEGQRKVCGYATDLDNSGNYRKESVKSSNSEAG